MTTNRWRLYTEDINREYIESSTSAYFNSFSIYTQVGYWKGTKENSLVVEVITNESLDKIVMTALSDAIRSHNNQQAVMLTCEPIEMFMIEKEN